MTAAQGGTYGDLSIGSLPFRAITNQCAWGCGLQRGPRLIQGVQYRACRLTPVYRDRSGFGTLLDSQQTAPLRSPGHFQTAPDLAEQVLAGSYSFVDACDKARIRKAEAETTEEAIIAEAPDLADLPHGTLLFAVSFEDRFRMP